jgi:hypothetical protein
MTIREIAMLRTKLQTLNIEYRGRPRPRSGAGLVLRMGYLYLQEDRPH